MVRSQKDKRYVLSEIRRHSLNVRIQQVRRTEGHHQRNKERPEDKRCRQSAGWYVSYSSNGLRAGLIDRFYQTGFDALQRVFQKIKIILEKEKSEVPRFYLGTLMKLEDFVKEVSVHI